MSTKTTLKRIALVAVSALGFGLVSSTSSSIAAAPADNGVVRAIVYGDTTQESRSTVARAGIPTSTDIYFATGSTVAGETTITGYVKFSAVPSGETVLGVGSRISPTLTTGSGTGAIMAGSQSLAVAAATSITAPATITLVGSAGTTKTYDATAAKSGGAKVATATFTPGAVGTYKLITWVDDDTSGNTNGALDALERNATKTIVVGGAPTTIVATALNATSGAVGVLTAGSGSTDNKGTVYQISLTDAAGNNTSLISGEAVRVAATDGTVSDASLTAADFNVNGYAYVKITDTADTAGTLTLTAVGFTATTVTSSYAATAANATATSVTFTQTTGISFGSGFTSTANTAQSTAVARSLTFQTGKAVTMRVTAGSSAAATDRVAGVLVVDNDGDVSGDAINYTGADDSATGSLKNPNYSLAVAIDDDLGYGSVTLPTSGLVSGDSITVYWPRNEASNPGSYAITLTAADSALSATNSSITPASANIVTGGGIELTSRCVDQFGLGMAGCSVSWNVTALTRNATATPTIKIADAQGYSTFTLTDTSTSTTVLTSTVTATMAYGSSTNTESASVTFGAGNAVDAIAVYTSPTKTVATTESSISTSATGPEAGAVTLAFLVTDANGVALSGVPVTLTADSTDVSWKSSYLDTANNQLVYTSSAGIATTYIAGWVAPSTVTVTATAGTKTVTTKVNLVTTAASARTIAVATADGIAKATVKDRFGNPVKGATVNWSRTGTGYFGSGVSATTGTTDVNGEAEILFIGDGTVKAELAVATYAQCDDAAGYVGITATSGTGASLAPAGVCSATVAVSGSVDKATEAAQAASDAALEAIDAANAATDAANLAAEAADAATVAAEEARDAADAATAAVEALASEVATLMAALKAQLTTLAKTVAKIAKKVKA